MTIGTLMEIENCQIHGEVSLGSRYWMKTSGWIYMVQRLTRKQTTSTPGSSWPEIWKDMSEASKRKEKQKWAIEKPKLDNARKLRGSYFTDPADEEFKLTRKNARRKLEVPMPAAMPCKTRGREYRETCSALSICKTKYACIDEADESTRKRTKGTLHKDDEEHIAEKGINSLSHYNLFGSQIYSFASGNEKPDAEAAVDK